MDTKAFLEAYSKLTPDGWLSISEALLLVTYAEETEGPIIEVGSYQGRSAMLFAQLPDRRTGKYDHATGKYATREVYCVDPWGDDFSTDLSGKQIFYRFRQNMRRIRARYYAVPLRVEAWHDDVKSEFVYLDGDHSYQGTLNQIDKALQCNPKYIAVHDVNDDGEGVLVKQAALAKLGHWQERIERVAVWSIKTCMSIDNPYE